MPELPEVETIRHGLSELIGCKVGDIFRSDKKLRIGSTLDLSLLNHKILNKINRRARYLILDFSGEYSLIVHLGMSGSIVLNSKDSATKNKLAQNKIEAKKHTKHDHFICEFNNGARLVFNDPRRFGFIDLIYTQNLWQYKMLAKLGPEPLLAQFNAQYLAKKLCHKKTNIKTTMMDNEIVVGVGNIYINESLFASAISPLRSASSLTKDEIAKLVKNIKNILKKAIKLGGSSINDYVNHEGEKGNFQNNFKVYGNNGKKCLLCNDIITKIVQNGRSSFYCKNCQK